MPNVELLLLALGIAIIRPLLAFATMSLAGPWQVPWPVQVSIAIMLALFVMPHVNVATFTGNPLQVLPMLGAEALIGIAIGLALQMSIAAARIAGELVSNTIGLGFAQMMDPEYGHSVPTLAQFMGLIAIAVFMAMDGHIMMIRLLTESYQALPPGGGGLTPAAQWAVLKHGDNMFAAGFMMALPLVAATLVVQLAMAVAARMAPSLNLMAVGMPATLIGGLLMLGLTVPVVSDSARSAVTSSFKLAGGIVMDGGPLRFAPSLAMMIPVSSTPLAIGISRSDIAAATQLLFEQPVKANAPLTPSASAPVQVVMPISRSSSVPLTRSAALKLDDKPLATASTTVEGLSELPQVALSDQAETLTAAFTNGAGTMSAAGGTKR